MSVKFDSVQINSLMPRDFGSRRHGSKNLTPGIINLDGFVFIGTVSCNDLLQCVGIACLSSISEIRLVRANTRSHYSYLGKRIWGIGQVCIAKGFHCRKTVQRLCSSGKFFYSLEWFEPSILACCKQCVSLHREY